MFARLLSTLVIVLAATSCSRHEAGEPRATFRLQPDAQTRLHLHQHVTDIFADVSAEDGYQLKLDRKRVSDIHQLAFLVELYKMHTGNYPFVDPTEGAITNVIFGDDTERDDEHHVDDEVFVAELARVLGDSLVLPLEPTGDAARHYVYSVYGRNYGVAAMLYHPTGWSEGIQPEQWQYRLGSSESAQIPMLQASKLFAGDYTAIQAPQWRNRSRAR